MQRAALGVICYFHALKFFQEESPPFGPQKVLLPNTHQCPLLPALKWHTWPNLRRLWTHKKVNFLRDSVSLKHFDKAANFHGSPAHQKRKWDAHSPQQDG